MEGRVVDRKGSIPMQLVRLLAQQQQQQQQQIDPTGGITQSIFTEAEGLLINESDYQRALEFVVEGTLKGKRRTMDRYRSMVDFLFCELHPSYRRICQAFYEGQARPLRQRPESTLEQIGKWDRTLVVALKVARQRLEANRSTLYWAEFAQEVDRQLAAA